MGENKIITCFVSDFEGSRIEKLGESKEVIKTLRAVGEGCVRTHVLTCLAPVSASKPDVPDGGQEAKAWSQPPGPGSPGKAGTPVSLTAEGSLPFHFRAWEFAAGEKGRRRKEENSILNTFGQRTSFLPSFLLSLPFFFFF